MRSVLALMRAAYLTASSYKLALVLSVAALLVSVAPLYFVSGALQPVVAESIAREGGQYFGFLVVGLAAMYAITMAVGALPSALQGSIGSGTLESLLVTRTPLPNVLLGLVGYPVLQGSLRGLVLVGGGAVAGADVHWTALPLAIGIVALLVAAYLSFGLVGGALILLFRTAGPLGTAVIALSGLLGGVYYSTTVIPAWLQDLSGLIPLTYGLRALRMALLGGAPFAEVANDVSILTMQAVLMLGAGAAIFAAALRRARIAGTLSQY